MEAATLPLRDIRTLLPENAKRCHTFTSNILFAHQKRIFNANWICLDVAEVLVICPAVVSGDSPLALPEKTIRPGSAKLGWLRILKNSARNSTFPPSPNFLTGVSFTSEKSRFLKAGPLKIFLPAFPKNPAVGVVNAQGSK